MVRSARRLVFLLLMVALTGAVLLSSPASPGLGVMEPPSREGATGAADRILRAILSWTTFDNALPTEPADRIKSLMLRGGATAMAVVALIAWGLTIRKPTRSLPDARAAQVPVKSGGRGEVGLGSDERDSLLGPVVGDGSQPAEIGWRFFGRILSRRPTLLGWAGLVGVGWLAWSVVACQWSHSPREATSFAEVFAFVLALAAVAGATLDRSLVQRAGSLWLGVVVLLSALVLWRASSGMPGPAAAETLFAGDGRELAGLLVPSFVLAVVLLAWRWSERVAPDAADPETQPARRNLRRISLVFYGVVALVAGGAILCCGDGPWRSAILATVAGLGVSAVLLARGRWRIVASIGAAVLTPAIGWLLIATDRPATVVTPDRIEQILAARPMIDAERWSLAGELIGCSPMLGNGPWASRLLADRLAQSRSLTDPRWSTRPVVSIENFWLEQWADLGVVGVGLLLAALVLLTVAASQAIARCPWRRHRWLIAALVGGLIGLAVQEFFASSAVRPAFAAVAAAWAGLAAAATRWAVRPMPEKNDDPYTIGFYPGSVFFLAGAAVMLGAIGFIVVKDYTSARGQYEAVWQDLPAIVQIRREVQAIVSDPRKQGDPAWRSLARADLGRADRHMIQAVDRLDDAARWSIDLDGRISADWQRSRAAFEQVAWRVAEQGGLQQAGLVDPPVLAHTAQWTDAILPAMAQLQAIDLLHPAGVPELAASLAEGSLLIARGRYLSYQPLAEPGSTQADQNQILIGEIERAVAMSRVFLDRRLREDENPCDLPAALLREQIASPVMLAQRLAAPWRLADTPYMADTAHLAEWLVARCRLGLSPADRVRLMRDSLRDFALLAGRSATWQIVITSPDWPPLEAGWYDAMIRAELGMDIAQPTLDAMLRAAERVERDPSNAWVESPDADIRNAPQTFRLAAELILVARRIPQPAGLSRFQSMSQPDATSGSNPTSRSDDENFDLKQAHRWLAAAQRLYDRGYPGRAQPRRFVIQSIAVRLQRAQLAWFLGEDSDSKLVAEKLAAEACDLLPLVDEFHRPIVAQAVATVRAFLLAQADRPADAHAWLMQTRFAGRFSLVGFQSQLGSIWRQALTRQIIPPPVPTISPTTQPTPPNGAIDQSPLFPPPGVDQLWPTRRPRPD